MFCNRSPTTTCSSKILSVFEDLSANRTLLDRGGLSKGLRGAIAQGHHKIGGTTLADFKMDILVAFFIFLKGTYICDPVILIHLP